MRLDTCMVIAARLLATVGPPVEPSPTPTAPAPEPSGSIVPGPEPSVIVTLLPDPATSAMTGEQWASSLLSGVAGAVVGLVGVFWAFHLTKNHGIREASKARTFSHVATLLERILRITDSPYGSSKEVRELIGLRESLMMFYLREMGDHPKASAWAHQQTDHLRTLIGPTAEVRAAQAYCALIAEALTEWAHGGFESDRLQKQEVPIESSWLPRIDLLNRWVLITRAEAADPTSDVQDKIQLLHQRGIEVASPDDVAFTLRG